MNGDGERIILVSPHLFPDLRRERDLAEDRGFRIHETTSVEEFRDALPSAEVVMMTPYAKLNADDFPKLTHCKAIIRYGIGYDNINVAAANAAGIPVSIVPGTASEEVASHAFAMGLALARRLPAGDHAIREGGWGGRIGYDTPVLSELHVGVLGMGRIGQHVARMYSAVGATVIAYDPFVTESSVPMRSIDEVLESSDVVSLHLPLTAETHHLISQSVIDRMRPGAIVVNVSRGGLVDEVALAEALIEGKLAGAGIDTFESEPLGADHPIRFAPNTMLTPHIAWRSNRSTDALQEGAVERLRRYIDGEQLIDLVTE